MFIDEESIWYMPPDPYEPPEPRPPEPFPPDPFPPDPAFPDPVFPEPEPGFDPVPLLEELP